MGLTATKLTSINNLAALQCTRRFIRMDAAKRI
jgi:hypothetical protein